MSSGCVATMSTLGFITDDMNLAMDRHITYYFASRRDQSRILQKVPSFEWTLMQYQGDKKRLMTGLKTELIQYFTEISESADCEVTSDTSDDDGTYTLGIAVRCLLNGKFYDLQSAVLVSGQSYQLLRTARGN